MVNIFRPKPDAEEQIFFPFGPVMGYKKLSAKFVADMNAYFDKDVASMTDYSDQLVGKVKQELFFTDEMRDTLLNDFKEYRNNGKFVLANMTDTMFMCHPDWNEKTYAFVHFDGPHMSKDVLTEAQKGKYNQDTESFLSSPSFMRIATEVGLSIAGGIAGVAMAPFSGGSSLALTATTAARIARIARPLFKYKCKHSR